MEYVREMLERAGFTPETTETIEGLGFCFGALTAMTLTFLAFQAVRGRIRLTLQSRELRDDEVD